jgi:ABC-type cobalamin/Fe3+-siderophores transport system ATPase subunit
VSDHARVIELLGIGVHKQGAWRLRRLCARFENHAFVGVLSGTRDERLTLLDVIVGREVPSEGRAWIDGIPLGADTASRIRQRVGVVDLARPMVADRTAVWNVAGRDRLGSVGDFFTRSWLASSHVAALALARVGLAAETGKRTAELDAWSRIALAVARALRGGPGRLVVAEPDAHVPAEQLSRLLQLLRTLISRDGLSVVVSLGDPDLARHTDITLHVAPPGQLI